ncbi:MAG: SufD family Fe-S cluster assembly protein [Sulfurospirillaceae bacterium]|nr:SufD family Fe-S cluster assembly protein [Sulfurospirillaceae bacterium]
MLLNDLSQLEGIKDTKSFDLLSEMGLPTKSTEEFRQFDISDIFSKNLLLHSDEVKLNGGSKYPANQDFYTVIIFDGEVDIKNSILPDSVVFSKKEKNLHRSPNSLYFLSEAFVEKENEIAIKKDLEKPLMILNIYSGDDSFVPTSESVVIEENCKVDIVELNISNHLRNSFVNANKKLIIKDNASLNYTKLQSSTTNNSFISNIEPIISKNAKCSLIAIDLDSKRALNIVNSTLSCDHSNFSFESIIKLGKKNKSGNIISIVHDAEFTESNMVCKHLLDGESQALFEVKTTVNHEAKFSKTFQNSQTILLKNGARINANPKLILHTDELEAAHGATSGSLDEEALYYMQSRGIELPKAEKMLINAIELQVIEKIGNESIEKLALSFIED